MQSDKLLSQTIHFLRFPLIFSVVLSHTDFVGVATNGMAAIQKGAYPIYDFVHQLVKGEFASLDVSSFFFFAGFLFFYKTKFSAVTYANKLKNRVHTLLIPYFFWNALVILIMLGANWFLKGLTTGANESFADKSITEWLSMFWVYQERTPVAGQFWFIRDLMMMGLISPILYTLIKYLKWIWVPLVGYFWLVNTPTLVIGFGFEALFFFSLGAWFSIHGVNFATLFRSIRKQTLALFLVLVVVNMLLWSSECIQTYGILHNINVLIGMAAVFGWVARGKELNKINISEKIASSNFFIYAYHLIMMVFMLKVWVKIFSPVNDVSLIIGFFVLPILVAAIGMGIYHLLKKILPRFTAIITGGR